MLRVVIYLVVCPFKIYSFNQKYFVNPLWQTQTLEVWNKQSIEGRTDQRNVQINFSLINLLLFKLLRHVSATWLEPSSGSLKSLQVTSHWLVTCKGFKLPEGLVTCKDFKLPEDGSNQVAETCRSNLNNNKLINEKLICAFRWSVSSFNACSCFGIYDISQIFTKLAKAVLAKHLHSYLFPFKSICFSAWWWPFEDRNM